MTIHRASQWIVIAMALLTLLSDAMAAESKNVAVVVYAENEAMRPYAVVAQRRLEQLLTDNGLVVLDEAKANELRSGQAQMSDPTYLLTAEEFERLSRQYQIAGIYRLYLTGAVQDHFGFHSATSQVDGRYVGANAAVSAFDSEPMGIKGFPPSDGLTDASAIANAMQRAVDSAARRYGLKVIDEVATRTIALTLKEVRPPPSGSGVGRIDATRHLDSLAVLHAESRKEESVTCRALSPDGGLAALAGYEHYTTFIGGMKRQYGSRLHIVDVASKREIQVLEMHPIANRESGENGSSEIFDCAFLGSWRYLAAVSGNKLAIFDVERGKLLAEQRFADAPSKGRLELLQNPDAEFLILQLPRRRIAYSVRAQE